MCDALRMDKTNKKTKMNYMSLHSLYPPLRAKPIKLTQENPIKKKETQPSIIKERG
jgi:hypothetical protein